MAVFPHHTRANECCQLAGHAASRVVPGTLQDHQAFPCNGILPDLADFYGSAIRRAIRVGVRHWRKSKPMNTKDSKTTAPALARYAQGPLAELWKRPGLTPRDRSIVTIAALIARNETIEMPYYINLALDNGVKPREISEITTHLAFYSGWADAMSAVAVAKHVFG